jgi:hypothetical protein
MCFETAKSILLMVSALSDRESDRGSPAFAAVQDSGDNRENY